MKACLQQLMFCSREEFTSYLIIQQNEKSTQSIQRIKRKLLTVVLTLQSSYFDMASTQCNKGNVEIITHSFYNGLSRRITTGLDVKLP